MPAASGRGRRLEPKESQAKMVGFMIKNFKKLSCPLKNYTKINSPHYHNGMSFFFIIEIRKKLVFRFWLGASDNETTAVDLVSRKSF